MKDQATKSRFVELRAQGWSYARVSKELQVSKQTLIAWAKDLKFAIANLRAIELEALQEQYYITKTKRIELLGKRIGAIDAELEQRTLDKVSTEWLLDYLVRSVKLLKDEEVQTVFSEEQGAAAALVEKLDKTVSTWSA